MNLHICRNGNFINQAMDVFEHFFPGENVFIVFNLGKPRTYREDIPVYRYDKNDPELLDKIKIICSKHTINHVLNHGLGAVFIPVFKYLKNSNLYYGKVYWIYWGYELYNALGEIGKYKLIDNNSLFSKLTYRVPNPINALLRKILNIQNYSTLLNETLPYVDYFCTWFYYDFELLHKHYDSHAKFKYFKYISKYKSDVESVDVRYYPKNLNRVMVNHQASLTGNHDTILKKLSTISGIENFEICTPLSYGQSSVRKHVLSKGKRRFGEKYNPILELMPFEEYDEFLASVSVAVFGAMRQEAAGNMMMLLRKGVKVFLRERNPLLQYYKEKGFLVFSFEKELNSISDLRPLSKEEQMHNIQVAIDTQGYYEDFMPSFFDE